VPGEARHAPPQRGVTAGIGRTDFRARSSESAEVEGVLAHLRSSPDFCGAQTIGNQPVLMQNTAANIAARSLGKISKSLKKLRNFSVSRLA
jgi:hypothetical protein